MKRIDERSASRQPKEEMVNLTTIRQRAITTRRKTTKDMKRLVFEEFLLFLFLSLLPIFDNTKIASYTILYSHSVHKTHRPRSTSLSPTLN